MLIEGIIIDCDNLYLVLNTETVYSDRKNIFAQINFVVNETWKLFDLILNESLELAF